MVIGLNDSNRREKGRERGFNGNEMDSIPLF